MATVLKKKKSKSSLDINYVDKFVNSVENKLYNFNLMFLTPYKKELDNGDSSVLNKISKNFNLPTLIIKNALDELWNHHWILGQQDVLSSEKNKRSNYSISSNELITFAIDPNQKIVDSRVEKRILKEQSIRVAALQKELNRKNLNQSDKNTIKANLDLISNELQQFLGSLGSRNVTQDKKNKQFASVDVRVRDLQETIRTMELKLSESNAPNPNTNGIDILNSTEFGTIYQNKRTLLLAQNYSEDYKKNVIKKIRDYFSNNEGVRPNNREQKLFNALTTRQENENQEYYQKLLKDPDLKGEDRTALTAIEDFIDQIKDNKSLNDKQIQKFATGESGYGNDAKVNLATTRLKNQTAKSDLYKDLAQQLIDLIQPYKDNKKVARYKENIPKIRNAGDIRNLLKTIKEREVKNILIDGQYKEGAFDSKSGKYKPIESIENTASNIFGIRRIKRIAETEISLAYNLGRLKKLEELGYKKVRVTNEAENRTNRDRVLALQELQKVKESYRLNKAYRLPNSKSYMPILCNHCLGRKGDEFDIQTDKVYESNVNTPYNQVDKRYSLFPPFHVSCWCYFEGVEDSRKAGVINTKVPPIKDGLVLSGIGLLSVASAYIAFNVLKRNPVAKNLTQTVFDRATDVRNTFNDALKRPKVNLPLNLTPKQIEDSRKILDVTDEAFEQIESNTRNLLGVSNVSKKSGDAVLDAIDNSLVGRSYKTLNENAKSFNGVLDDIPDYVRNLKPVIDSRERYYTLRNIIYDKSVPIETRKSIYNQYLIARREYEKQISNHLNRTRNLKSTVNNIQSQLTLDANRQILGNIDNFPPNTNLEDALNSVRSRNALTLTDTQLKSIRNNLATERKGIQEKINVESKVIDNTLDGIDTKQKAIDLKDSYRNIRNLSDSYISRNKALDKVITNIDSIKKELNNTTKLGNTKRNLLNSRLNSSNPIDRQYLLDNQEKYIKDVIKQQQLIISELKKLPKNDSELDDFINLYRSEIQNKYSNKYKYSQNLWSEKEIASLQKQYVKASDIVTARNTYQSYLEETEDILAKLSSFEKSISDSTIKFSSYENDNIKEKLSKLPSIRKIKFYEK